MKQLFKVLKKKKSTSAIPPDHDMSNTDNKSQKFASAVPTLPAAATPVKQPAIWAAANEPLDFVPQTSKNSASTVNNSIGSIKVTKPTSASSTKQASSSRSATTSNNADSSRKASNSSSNSTAQTPRGTVASSSVNPTLVTPVSSTPKHTIRRSSPQFTALVDTISTFYNIKPGTTSQQSQQSSPTNSIGATNIPVIQEHENGSNDSPQSVKSAASSASHELPITVITSPEPVGKSKSKLSPPNNAVAPKANKPLLTTLTNSTSYSNKSNTKATTTTSSSSSTNSSRAAKQLPQPPAPVPAPAPLQLQPLQLLQPQQPAPLPVQQQQQAEALNFGNFLLQGSLDLSKLDGINEVLYKHACEMFLDYLMNQKQDEKERLQMQAEQYLRASAAMGNEFACFDLAELELMHKEAPDMDEVRQYLHLAASKGHKKAIVWLTKLNL